MKYLLFLFILFAFISCEEKVDNKQLPYGYYEDNHWEDLKSYNLNGKVKSRLVHFNPIPKGTYSYQTDDFRLLESVIFDKNGYLTYSDRKEYPFERDTSVTRLNLTYSKGSNPKLIKVKSNLSSLNKKSTIFIWDSDNRLAEVINNDSNGKLKSKIVYQYLEGTHLKIKESRFEKSKTAESYINYSYNEKGYFLGWEQYWGNPKRLSLSNTLQYNKDNKLISSYFYDAFDSLKPSIHKDSIKSNEFNQPIRISSYSPTNDSIIEIITSFTYNSRNKIILKEEQRLDSTYYLKEIYNYNKDLLVSDIKISKYFS